jgi:CHAT domain-containing protein
MKTQILILLTILSFNIWGQAPAPKYYNELESITAPVFAGKAKPTSIIPKLTQLQQSLTSPDAYADMYVEIAAMYFLEGDYQEAIDEYLEGLEYLSKNTPKNDTVRFKLQYSIADNYLKIFQISAAEAYFERCYQQLKQTPQIEQQIPVYTLLFWKNKSTLTEWQGDIEATDIHLQKALEIANNHKNLPFRFDILRQLAEIKKQKKEYNTAIKYLDKAIELTAYDYEKAIILINKAAILIATKEYSQANNLIVEANQLFQNTKVIKAGGRIPAIELAILSAKANLAFEQKQETLAKKYYEAIKEMARNYYLTEQNQFIAQSNIRLGQITRDVKYLQKALISSANHFDNESLNKNPEFEQILFPKEALTALTEKSRLLAQTNPTLSTVSYLKTIELIGKIRRSYHISESKTYYTEQVFSIFEEALSNQKELSAEYFYQVIEHSKNSTLSDVLLDQKIKPKNIDSKLLQQEELLLAQRNKAQKELIINPNNESIKKLNEIQLKISILAKEIEKKSPKYFELKYCNSITNPKAIQSVLDEKTSMILYLLGQKGLFVQTISKDKISYKSIAIDSTFKMQLNSFFNILYKKPALGNYKGSTLAQSLYNQLIKPIETEIRNKSRLVILRDAELNFLPFEVLESKPNHYLLHDFAVSYAYSATIWYQTLRNKSIEQNSLLSIAPYTNQNALPATFRDQTLQPLPASGNEVAQIGGTIYRDNSATKNKFIEDYRKHGIIHFATHAQIDDTNPSKSFIAFYPQGADYKLFTEELYNLDLRKTRLVVLSACEAGRGKLVKGEGLMSLARGFAYSGCPSVVTTLWNAHDESMAFLSARLHEYLQEDLPIDVALQKAKIDYFNSKIGKELDHPYYWANFILIGNNEPVFENEGIKWWIWGLIGVVLLVFFILIWQNINKNRLV